MMRRIKRLIFIIISLFLIFSFFFPTIFYNSLFYKRDTPKYSNEEIKVFNEIKGKYEFSEYDYSSMYYTLHASAYLEGAKDLVVVSHGFNNNSSSMLPLIDLLIQNDYKVFFYDDSGSGKSEGRLNGLVMPVIDLHYTLMFLAGRDEFKDLNKILLGYSAGGFASTAVLKYDSDKIIAAASISGYNSGHDLFYRQAKRYIGPLIYLGYPLVNAKQKRLFKDYLTASAREAIDSVDIPIFLAHGRSDKKISIKKDSIIRYYLDTNKDNIDLYLDYSTHYNIVYEVDDEGLHYNEGLINALFDFLNKI